MDAQHVRIDSDAWMAMTGTLREIEREKRKHAPGSTEFAALADQVEELTKIVLDLGQRQSTAAAVARATSSAEEPIDSRAAPRSASELIEQWREAERRLSLAAPDSREFVEARADVERLRAEYRDATRRLD
jgi:hypothetical protein